jgi:hypothetical protein
VAIAWSTSLPTANKTKWSLGTKEKDSVAFGFLTADLVSGVLFTVLPYLTGDSSSLERPADFAISLLLALLIGTGYSAVPITILALPLYLVLRRTGLINRWSTLIFGIIIGGITAWVLERPNRGVSAYTHFDWSDHAVRLMAGFAAIGGIAALSFWSVWSRRQRSSKIPSS